MSQVLDFEHRDQFLTFEDAVQISRKLEDFFNSTDSNEVLLTLQSKFENLRFKNDFFVKVEEIRKNCEECMGCKDGECILGCFIDENPNMICFWDEALETLIGTKLVVHEFGHVIFDQIFENDLSPELAFRQSEEFAQFFEENFQVSIEFCQNCSERPLEHHIKISNMHIDEMADQFIGSIIGGIGFGIGSIVLSFLILKISGQGSELVELD